MNVLLITNLKLITSILALTYAIILIQNSSKYSPTRYFGFAEASLGLWNLFSSLQIQISDVDIVILLRSLIYIFSDFACTSILLYCFLSTSIITSKHKKYIILSYAIPIISLIATLFSFMFLRINPYIVNPELNSLESIHLPFQDYMFQKKPLYFFHCIYCYLLLFLTIILFLKNIIINPKENKRIISLTTIGIIVFFIPNIYRIFIENFKHENIETLSPYFDGFAFIFMCTISFIAIYFDKNENSINICKTRFYNYAGLPIFIFSKNMKFLQLNKVGKEFIKTYGIPLKKFDNFEQVFPESKLKILGIPGTNTENSNSEFYISVDKDQKIYYGQKQEIKSLSNKTTGYFIFLSKLDFYTEIIKQLERTAYTDEISGCRKRFIFSQYLNCELQNKSETQLICTAALDNLEKVNKNYSILQADSYIKNFSEFLKNLINNHKIMKERADDKKIEIFRMYGASFMFILPIEFEKVIVSLFKTIRSECIKMSENKSEPITCSLGYSVGNENSPNSDNIIQKSYTNMLLDRKSHIK